MHCYRNYHYIFLLIQGQPLTVPYRKDLNGSAPSTRSGIIICGHLSVWRTWAAVRTYSTCHYKTYSRVPAVQAVPDVKSATYHYHSQILQVIYFLKEILDAEHIICIYL